VAGTRRSIAIIAGTHAEALSYVFFHPTPGCDVVCPESAQGLNGYTFDELWLVGMWYHRRDLTLLYVETLSRVVPTGKVLVIRP
jgi:hypothetical protein